MPQSWTTALSRYNYPVSLAKYGRSGEFPGFFTRDIPGDRTSTIEFEDYFRANCAISVVPYLEVVFWVLCGQSRRFERAVNRTANHLLSKGIQPAELRSAIDGIIEIPARDTVSKLRDLLGIKVEALTVALTFPAFADPMHFPMVNKNTAGWVKEHHCDFSLNRSNRLTPFALNYSALRYNDFDNYLNWVMWCRETAEILTSKTDMEWRARDVEMAVFTAAREGLSLNPLP
jgi:hypothetical protein